MQKLLILIILLLLTPIAQAATPRESTAYIQAKVCMGNQSCKMFQGTGVAIDSDDEYTYIVTAYHTLVENGIEAGEIQVAHIKGSDKGELVGHRGDLALIKIKGHKIGTVCVGTEQLIRVPVTNISHDEADFHQARRRGFLLGEIVSFPSKQGASGSGVFDDSGDLVGIITTTNGINSFIIPAKKVDNLVEVCFKRPKKQKPKQAPVPEPIPEPVQDMNVPPPVDNRLDMVLNNQESIKDTLKDLRLLVTDSKQIIKDLKDPTDLIKGLGPKIEGLGPKIQEIGPKINNAVKNLPKDDSKIDKLTNLAGWGLGLAALIGIPGLGCLPFVIKGLGGVKTAVKGISVIKEIHHQVGTWHPIPGVNGAPVNVPHQTQVIIPGAATPGDMRSVDSVVLQPGNIDTGLQAFQAMKDALVKKYPQVDNNLVHQMDTLFNQFYSGLSPKRAT